MGLTEGFDDSEHIPGAHPRALSAPIPQEHLQAVRSTRLIPENQHPPEHPSYQQPENPKMSYFAWLPPSQTATGRVPRALPPSHSMYIYGFAYWSFPLHKPAVFQAPAARLCWEQTKRRLDFSVGRNSRGRSSALTSAGLLTMKKAIFQTTVVTTELFMGFFFFLFIFERVADKILLQELVFRDGSRRRKENIYFLFLLVNQNVLFKESALCRIAHELLPLMEIKKKYQEVFLVIPFPCLFSFSLNSLYTHVLAKCLR